MTKKEVPRTKKNSKRNKSARRKAQATGSGGAFSVPTGSARPSRPWDPRRELPTRGLVNLGNTCFLNSALQNLFKTRPLHEALFGDAFGRREGAFIGPVNEAFRKTLLEMGDDGPTTRKRGAYSPKELLSAVQRVCPSFKGSREQDAHELLMILLGTMEDEEVAYMKERSRENKEEESDAGERQGAASAVDGIEATRDGNSSKETTTTALPSRAAITDVFGGMVCSQVTCSTCATRSFSTEPTICLSLEIAHNRLAAKTTKVKETTKVEEATKIEEVAKVADVAKLVEPVNVSKVAPGTTLPGPSLSKKQKRKLARRERQREKALDKNTCRAVARSDRTRNGNRTSQAADRAHTRAADSDEQSRGVELPSALSNDGCISDEGGGLVRYVREVARREEGMAGAKRSESLGGGAVNWYLPGSQDGCAAEKADGIVGIPEVRKAFMEWNDDGDIDDEPRTDTPGSTLSGSSWKSDASMSPVGAGPGTRSPSPSPGKHTEATCQGVDQHERIVETGEKGPADGIVPLASDAEDSVEMSDGVTSGDEEDAETPSPAVAKSPLNRLMEPPSRMKKTERCEHLYDCLDGFVAEEALIAADGNGYDCEACSTRTKSRSHEKIGKGRGKVEVKMKKQDARKRLLLLGNPPGVLVCHLKRLQATKKIARRVKFDLEMDMSPYFWQDPQAPHDPMETLYRLFGLVQHEGSHLGGHYVAYFRDTDGWKHASDSMVRTATLQEVNNCEAYMLFYERCDLDHPAN